MRVAGEGGAQRAAARVKGQRRRTVDHARLAQRVRRGQRGVAAQVDLDGGREPAQAEGGRVVRRREERRLGDAELEGDGLHARRRRAARRRQADGGRVAAEGDVAEGVDPGDRDRHDAHDAKRASASSRTSARLQKAQRTSVLPASGSAGVVEDRARDGHDPAPAREGQAELLGAQARGDRARCRWWRSRWRRAGTPRSPSASRPSHSWSRLASSSAARRPMASGGEPQAPRDGQLERGGAGVGQELLRRPHRGHQRRRAAHPSHLPSGEGERLAARGDGEGALAHAGQGGQRDVRPVEDQVLVDLVGHRQEVVGSSTGRRPAPAPRARTPCRSGCAAS